MFEPFKPVLHSLAQIRLSMIESPNTVNKLSPLVLVSKGCDADNKLKLSNKTTIQYGDVRDGYVLPP